MEFRVLGTLELVDDGRILPPPAPRLRSLLAALLVRPHQTVSMDDLIDCLWDDDRQPANPKSSIHTYVRRLRAIVGDDLLQTESWGYRLMAEPADLAEFRRLVAAAAAAGTAADRADLLRAALDLWRGEPLGGVPSERLRRDVVPGLTEERLTALEDLYAVRLKLGEQLAVLPELTSLSARHPLRERLHAQLMTALYRSGRQPDALSAYDAIAARLADEFGLDPGDELAELRQAILIGALDSAPATADWNPQNQLPLDIRDLVGRDELLAQVERLAHTADGVPVLALTGTPGIGKSAVAVRAGHRLAEAFPDGQWFVRLRGASDSPRDAGEVLIDLLRLSGVDPLAIPDGLDARSATLRARLAGRRVLVVLDDARDAEQVRPLLPGTAGSAVIITSRSSLDALIALDGATGLRLTTLSADDGTSLVAALLGQADDPEVAELLGQAGDPEVAELVAMCGGLPLALRIAGANAARRSLPDYIARMRATGPLTMLTINDETTVSTAFRTSYELLDPLVQQGFRLLATFPGAEFSGAAAGAMLGDGSTAVLNKLEAASLLQAVGVDRFVMHDLVKQYGALLAATDSTVPAAWNALCDWYLGTTDAVIGILHPGAVRLPVESSTGTAPAGEADAWLMAELPNLVAIAAHALVAGTPDVAWRLADVVRIRLGQLSLVDVWRTLTQLGMRGAHLSGDVLGVGAMEHSRGVLARVIGEVEQAIEYHRRAHEQYRAGGFVIGEAAVLCNVGNAYSDLGQLRRSADALAEGIDLFRSAGESHRLPRALTAQSRTCLNLAEFRAAAGYASEAIELATDPTDFLYALVNRSMAYRFLGWSREAEEELRLLPLPEDPTDRAQWRLALASLRNQQGDPEGGLRFATEALQDSAETGSSYDECFSSQMIGESHLAAGDYAAAKGQLEQVAMLAEKSGYGAILAETRGYLARCNYEDGQVALAYEQATTAFAELQAIEYRIGEHYAQVLLAECCAELGLAAEAEKHRAAITHFIKETGYAV